MFKAVAPTLAIEPVDVPLRNEAEIEPTIESLARRANSALIVAGDTLVETPAARETIIDLTAKHRLPALYGVQSFAPAGGLLVYGIDPIDPYRRGASYVIASSRARNRVTCRCSGRRNSVSWSISSAKALGLELSPILVATADEVIE